MQSDSVVFEDEEEIRVENNTLITEVSERSVAESRMGSGDFNGDGNPYIPATKKTLARTFFFSEGSETLNDNDRSILQIHARILVANPGRKIQIMGHCGDRGSLSYNKALAAKRSRVVKDQLKSYGVAANRIEASHFCPEVLSSSADNEDRRARNRVANIIYTPSS